MIEKEQILVSAFSEFASKGIKEVSMDDIAGALRISKKTLYSYFEGKKDLVAQSIEYNFSMLVGRCGKLFKCMPNPLTAMVFVAIENLKFVYMIEEEFLMEIKASLSLTRMLDAQKAELNVMRDEAVNKAIAEGFILNSQGSDVIMNLFREKLPAITEIKKYDKFPCKLCFDIVTTLLGSVCTPAGRMVLEELKENYS